MHAPPSRAPLTLPFPPHWLHPETARNALAILGLSGPERENALTKQDFIVFLYAMGLVSSEDVGTKGAGLGCALPPSWTTAAAT